eukprot:Seg2114.5 transcript_id=Seg2114.5/GoldUCD/mRNA.D3Y31 product="hypothetical protein" protein_id=Seg2114.5/GoldUCD/D3Y31
MLIVSGPELSIPETSLSRSRLLLFSSDLISSVIISPCETWCSKTSSPSNTDPIFTVLKMSNHICFITVLYISKPNKLSEKSSIGSEASSVILASAKVRKLCMQERSVFPTANTTAISTEEQLNCKKARPVLIAIVSFFSF